MSYDELTEPVEMMLERLDKVRRNGKRGWVARCPSHEDKMASLSIGSGAGGRVLLNCFAGCAALDVVQAVGLSLSDLFPRPITDDMTREERNELHATAMRSRWAAALDVLDRESLVVFMAAGKMSKGGSLDANTLKRVAQAADLIERARVILKTGPAKRRLDRVKTPTKERARP